MGHLAYRFIIYLILCPTPFIHPYTMEPCSRPIQPQIQKMKMIQGPLSRDPSQLLRTVAQHPCLEVYYYGCELSKSPVYTIYGTCDFRQMFRYHIRLVPLYDCWKPNLATWNTAASSECNLDRSSERVVLIWHNQLHLQLRSGVTNSPVTIVALNDSARNGRAVDGCNCQLTENRSLAGLWRKECAAAVPNKKFFERHRFEVWSLGLVLLASIGGVALFNRIGDIS